MKVIVRVSESFKRQVKPLLKKFKSLKQDLANLENQLIEKPRAGTPIGQDSYKIRLAVKSKRKGKSGGLRVISHIHIDTEIIGVVENNGDGVFVTLIAIYDKSETASISDKDLKDLIIGLQIK